MIVILSGGTGGAKLIEGLAAEVDPAELTIICNTGDDCFFHGLHISPDIDTIIYTLAGMSDAQKGWGIKGDTFTVLEQLGRLGNDTWFALGDQDLATHITRTRLLNDGRRLSEVTDRLRMSLGVRAAILPMSDDRVETRVATPGGELSFQEYFVREHWQPDVTAVRYLGAERSRPAPSVLEAIHDGAAIVIAPSNPITSIGPILAVPGVRTALQETAAPVVGISPIVGNAAISGPAHKLMTACGWDATALGAARGYGDFLDYFFVATEDEGRKSEIAKMGIDAVAANIRMDDLAGKRRLARELLALVGE